MTFFSWFKPKSDTHHGRDSGAHAAPLVAHHRETPAAHNTDPVHDAGLRLKNERAKMRDLLYNVVRESMVRVGILSSNFKFKVLATDPKGEKFIVMMDLPPSFGSEISQLAEIEPIICRAAKARYNITVSAVYWRAELPPVTAAAAAPVAPPVATKPPEVAPPPRATPAPFASSVPPEKPKVEPVLADEVSALKRILAAGGVGTATPTPSTSPQNHALLTGYENTEIVESEMPADQSHAETQAMVDPDDDPYPLLSPTQYGELR